MANETQLSLQTLQLSAREVSRMTGWGQVMINDYLAKFQDFTIVANQIDDTITQVDTNTEDIQTNADNLAAHEEDTSAHGVNGENIGTEDYAQLDTGGAVLLAEFVNDAIDSGATISTPDVGTAPDSYSQTYAQDQTALINEIKAAHNQLVTDVNNAIAQLNLFLESTIIAKQMADS